MIGDRYRKAKAWQACFMDAGELTPLGEVALTQLRNFCGVLKNTLVLDNQGRADPIQTAINEGKRQVWLFVQSQLHLSDDVVARMRDSEQRRMVEDA